MNLSLLKLALDRIEASDWSVFEKFCSQFLASEYADLRTTAHPSGDGGRDAELQSPKGNSFIAIQYSVTKSWRSKIQNTKTRLEKEFPDVRILIFMSNHPIGSAGDKIKQDFINQGMLLDIRDRNWFIERATSDPQREDASEELINQIARPYLRTEKIIDRPSSPLSSNEARAALTYLGLQWQDDISDKGLTKLSFEALIRSVLRHTTSDNRLKRQNIHEIVIKLLPSVDNNAVISLIDAALKRLTKRYIRHWVKEDEFCLTHEEHLTILNNLAVIENQEAELLDIIGNLCREFLDGNSEYTENDIDDLKFRVLRTIENLFLRQGESFAQALQANNLQLIGFSDLNDIIYKDLNENHVDSKLVSLYPAIISSVIKSVLCLPSDVANTYLRRLSTSYTLFSFLNQTPDVQSATKVLFSYGTIWLDSTVLLPLIAEQLFEDPSCRKIERLFEVCRNAGIEFRVTSGIIHEIIAHMNKAVSCSKYIEGTWEGRIPFLYRAYLNTGQSKDKFSRWISFYRGTERPDDDLEQYLLEQFNINKLDLNNEVDKINTELRYAMDRLWSEVHEERRRGDPTINGETTRILIQNDIETYLGVVALRKQERTTELGYRHWLLTFDKNAWTIKNKLNEEFPKESPTSPLLSFPFLVNAMTFGPSRSKVSKSDRLSLPFLLESELVDPFSVDIMQLAYKVREENQDLPEHVIRRKVRDAIDKARKQKSIENSRIDFEVFEL